MVGHLYLLKIRVHILATLKGDLGRDPSYTKLGLAAP